MKNNEREREWESEREREREAVILFDWSNVYKHVCFNLKKSLEYFMIYVNSQLKTDGCTENFTILLYCVIGYFSALYFNFILTFFFNCADKSDVEYR